MTQSEKNTSPAQVAAIAIGSMIARDQLETQVEQLKARCSRVQEVNRELVRALKLLLVTHANFDMARAEYDEDSDHRTAQADAVSEASERIIAAEKRADAAIGAALTLGLWKEGE